MPHRGSYPWHDHIQRKPWIFGI